MSGQDLFAIDVASELRSLAEAQLRGSWQLPAELVRFGVRRRAREISVSRRRGRIEVCWLGAAVDSDLLENLLHAIDRRAAAARRQRAIAHLEEEGAESLLWAAAIAGSRLRILAGGAELEIGRAGARLHTGCGAAAEDSVEIRWTCRGLDQGRTLKWAATATRFSPVEVSVAGQQARRGFAGGMYYMDIDEPLPCRIGLTRSGVRPVLWLLLDGVVAGRAVVPDYPPFEAAVELAHLVPRSASGGELRRAVQPFVPELVDHALAMVVRLSGRLDQLSASDRERLTVTALRAARCGLRVEELCRLPLLETLDPAVSRLSVHDVAALARGTGGRLYAVAPDRAEHPVLVDRSTTLCASTEVCDLLAAVTGIRWQVPPRHRERFWRRWLEVGGRRLRRERNRLRGLLAGGPMPDDELTAEELRLLQLLRRTLAPHRVAYGRRGVSARWSPNGVMIPRSHPALAAGRRLVAEDPRWLYPLLLALDLDGIELERARSAWRAGAEPGPISVLAPEVRQ